MSRLTRGIMTVVAASAVALGMLTAPAHAAETTRYVSLGDSFVAGPLITLPSGSPLGCLKSKKNYPSLIARDLGVDEFVDVSCSGAQTEDMFASQKTALGTNAPQLNALNADTTLVSIGIGGNDIGFADLLVTCVTRSIRNPGGSPCKELFVDPTTGDDELRARVDETAPKVAAVLAEIVTRAPNAQIVFVGYPAVLPESTGCFPRVPIARGDVAYLDGVERYLNSMLQEVTAEYGATYVDVYERGHDVCSSRDDRWVEGIIPTRPAAPVHPNAQGMDAIADVVLSYL
ncbi:SGNH/GDSL hydrolase family protein [Stackebrandtia soli]|uniref:SGNH/GDSL hydrolase family protein n=1 Tax=Stackebrandtia soli TaxID=1892856 RepID=UPI0039EC121D